MPVFAYEFNSGDTAPSSIELVGQGPEAAINNVKMLLMNQVILGACSLPDNQQDQLDSFGKTRLEKIEGLAMATTKLEILAAADHKNLPIGIVHPLLVEALETDDERFVAIDKRSRSSLYFDHQDGRISLGSHKIEASEAMNKLSDEAIKQVITANCNYCALTPQVGTYDKTSFLQHDTFGWMSEDGHVTPFLTVFDENYYKAPQT